MADFGINEMLEMQKALQDKYKDKWKPICPDRGKDQLLWMIGEIGEVIDIIKKHGGEKASQDAELREHLIEELIDVLMATPRNCGIERVPHPQRHKCCG